ncbi:hypothetical protein A3C24_00990 [Candidatus Roizmanbacteria bacterium RIFCSPHIGHO2_02_FULL_37_24]|uniref:Peptidase S54 rhomboid domain-containing protein n=1 Tax=Candidatus Roizmanbacteria bacterium RIFCSPHIGHO2_02_FULL_37_24 TaxID=1802037 RepID=A0A1F7GVW6_9BACT|nr:MAG: hypothetical protein A3C24_00990 [Candidatus Roizmanbacteria bacterium RIFCSPHIGHO2_02_FULL_37_24]OGK59496.1 MAG: hypothetical protein A3G65_00080 [Candidatus Roizmanbacteria bacterium RIFCSPLOWO2_12_FULL_37_7b]
MFPIRDTRSSSSIPFINYAIIFINIFVFILYIGSVDIESFIRTFGFTPADFNAFNPFSYLPIFTSMWMHGGILHLVLNMWFLHIFGDNVEDRVGHFRYLIFYILAGTAAVFSQYIFNTQSIVPIIGASGAISGITGMYIVYFPHSRIQALVPSLFGFWHMIKLPSWFFLGYWFVIQVFSGVGSLATIQYNEGGVAFFAHIGGFVFGYLIASLYKGRRHFYT